jgi:ribosomal protein S14
MAGTLLASKNNKQRVRFVHSIYNNFLISILKRDFCLPENYYYQRLVQGKLSGVSRIKTRCVFSSRAKAVLNKFRLSRMIFKKYAGEGNINGIKKASW